MLPCDYTWLQSLYLFLFLGILKSVCLLAPLLDLKPHGASLSREHSFPFLYDQLTALRQMCPLHTAGTRWIQTGNCAPVEEVSKVCPLKSQILYRTSYYEIFTPWVKFGTHGSKDLKRSQGVWKSGAICMWRLQLPRSLEWIQEPTKGFLLWFNFLRVEEVRWRLEN